MDKYYRLHQSISSNIVGRKYPQVERVFIPTTWDDKLFIQSYVGVKAPPNVLVPTGHLYKGAKLTDLISASSVGFVLNLVVSEKLKLVLEKYEMKDIQIIKTTIVDAGGTEYPYWIIHPSGSYLSSLNLEQSEVGYYSDMRFTQLLRPITVSDYKDLKKEVEYYYNNTNEVKGNLCIRKVAFLDNKVADFFPLRPVQGGIGFFVSNKLKDAIEKAGCTGIVFTEPNEPYP